MSERRGRIFVGELAHHAFGAVNDGEKSGLIHPRDGGYRPPIQKRIVDVEREKRKSEIIFLPSISAYRTTMSLNVEILSKAATEARGLCMDAVQASQSGHLGLPLGCAEIGAVLFGYALKYNPDQPRWINRDCFVLSGGHGSMFLYAWLHMSGYDLPMS